MLSKDFTSAGLSSKTKEGTGFHAAKSFDHVFYRKSKTMMFLTTTKWKDNSNKYVRVAVCMIVHLAFPT